MTRDSFARVPRARPKSVQTCSGSREEYLSCVSSLNLGLFLFGVVSLLSYSCFLQQLWYYSNRISENLSAYSQIVYGVVCNIVQLVCMIKNRDIPVTFRVNVSLSLLAVASMVLPFVAYIDMQGKLLCALIISGVLAAGVAMAQSSATGLGGIVSPSSMQYVYIGQSVSGLFQWPFLVVVEVFLKFIGYSGDSDQIVSFLLMGSSSVVLVLFIAYFKYVIFPKILVLKRLKPDEPDYIRLIDINNGYLSVTTSEEQSSSSMPYEPLTTVTSTKTLVLRMWPAILMAWLSWATTFAVYPREMVLWSPTLPLFQCVSSTIYVSTLIYLAICGDIFGLYTPLWGLVATEKYCHAITVLRILLVPLFTLSSIELFGLDNDWVRLFLVIALAVSGGFISAMVMVFALDYAGTKNGEQAGYVVSFALVNGLTVGSALGALISWCFE